MGITGASPRPAPPPIEGTRAGWLVGGHWVVIQAWAKSLAVVALLDEEGARPTGSGGEWEVHDRPRAAGITEWQGRRNKRLELPIIVEGWVTDAGGYGGARPRGEWIEGQLATLEEMVDTPHTIRLVGAVPHSGRQWAIEEIDYRADLRDVVTGRRMRQYLTLHLVEFIAPDELAKLPRAGAEPTNTRKYKIVRGDNLQKIAQKTLKKASRWKEIEKLNAGMRGIKLAPKKFPVGKQIKVPAK